MLTESSCLNLALMEKGTDSSTPRRAWQWTPMETLLLQTGGTAGSRLATEKETSASGVRQLLQSGAPGGALPQDYKVGMSDINLLISDMPTLSKNVISDFDINQPI